MSDDLTLAVKECVAILEKAVAQRLAGVLGKASVPRRERDMQCVHKDARGRRCAARSKGPRFKYLCDRHIFLKGPSR